MLCVCISVCMCVCVCAYAFACACVYVRQEARDNQRMLTPLLGPCSRLNKCQLTELPAILEEVVLFLQSLLPMLKNDWFCVYNVVILNIYHAEL